MNLNRSQRYFLAVLSSIACAFSIALLCIFVSLMNRFGVALSFAISFLTFHLFLSINQSMKSKDMVVCCVICLAAFVFAELGSSYVMLLRHFPYMTVKLYFILLFRDGGVFKTMVKPLLVGFLLLLAGGFSMFLWFFRNSGAGQDELVEQTSKADEKGEVEQTASVADEESVENQ